MKKLRARSFVAVGLFAVTLFGALVGSPREAAAAPAWMEADEHFRHGVQLFGETNYAAALIEFKRAYEIAPNFQVLYNVGQSYFQLQDYANALPTFSRYLEEGGAKIPIKRKKEVETTIATLSGRVATLTVNTNEPGATIAIDDVEMGKTPLAPLTVSAGRRKVTATISGRAPVTQVVDLAGRDTKTIVLEIAPEPKNEPPPPPPPEPPSIVPMVVTWSVTGALATGAIITGALALGASNDLETELGRFPGDAKALSSAKSKTFALGLTTDILIGASIAGAGLATYFTVDWKLASDDVATKTKAPTAHLSVSPTGVSFDGTF